MGRFSRYDLFVATGYLAGGIYVTAGLWLDPAHRHPADNQADGVLFEWMLAHGAQTARLAADPLFTSQLNAPYGANLMANTSMLGATLPLAPLTMLAGTGVSLAALLVLALAGTATAWYAVLSRHVVGRRSAAVAGAAFCGFGPALVSHAISQPNLCAQFLVPLIVLAVARLGGARPVRAGLALGALVVYQVFLNEELLLLTALGLGVYLLGYARQRPAELRRAVRPAATGLAVAAALSAALLAYPLWYQFFGRQAYHGLPAWIRFYGAWLDSYPGYSRQSLGGAGAPLLAQNPSEQNTFLGWGLCLLVVLIVRWTRRDDPRVIPLGVTAGVFAACSLGPVLILRGRSAGLPGPWALLNRLPVFDEVVPTRFGLVVTAAVGVLLAIFLDRARGRVGAALVALALLPLVPVPLRTAATTPVPRFVTSGHWRRAVPAGGTVVVAAVRDQSVPAMRWQIAAGMGFNVVGGWFLHPEHNVTGNRGAPGAEQTAVGDLLTAAADGRATADPARAATARAQLRTWRVDAVLLADGQAHAAALHAALDRMLGPAQRANDVWLWYPMRSPATTTSAR